MTPIEQVLDVARWAPSGDNTQPWRFEFLGDMSARIHCHDTRDHCVYDLDGWASEVSHGALLETVVLAASRYASHATIEAESETPGRSVYHVTLHSEPGTTEDPLARAIEQRTVQRGAMPQRRLSDTEKALVERCAEPYKIIWFESLQQRRAVAKLNAINAEIRLTIPEAYDVHRAVIAWNSTTSVDRLPSAALGANAALLASMRWAMKSWRRVDLMNRYAGGTLLPRLLLDFFPGIWCSAHFALLAAHAPTTIADRVAAGRAVQRLWLGATTVGLQVQPSYTPIVFARYFRERRTFTRVRRAYHVAAEVARRIDALVGATNAARLVFMGRIGPSRMVKGRSVRMPLQSLTINNPAQRSHGGAGQAIP